MTTKSGVNLVEVQYQNPAFTARRLAIRLTDKDGRDLGPQLRPFYATGRHEMTSAAAALALAGSDGLMLLLIAWLSLERCAATLRAAPAMWRAAIPIGGALFAIALFHHWSPDVPQPVIFIHSGNDGLAYESYAREALLDGWLLNSGALHGQPLLYTIGYHYWMSLAHAVFGESLVAVYFAHRLLFWSTVLFSAMTATRLFGSLAAVVTLLIGLYFSEYVFWPTSYVFRENLVIALNAALVYAVLASDRVRVWQAAVIGAVAGASFIADPINLAVIPLIGWFVWRSNDPAVRVKGLMLFAVGVAVFAAIVPLRNVIVTGVPTLLPTEGGPTLWWGNKPPAGLPTHAVEGDHYRIVWNYLITEPRHFAGTLLKKAVYAVGFYSIDWAASPEVVQFSLVNLLGLCLALCVAPALLGRDPRTVVLYAMAAVRYASEVVFLANHNVDRYEVTLLMLLLPVFGCAVVWLWRMTPSIVVLLAFAIAARHYMLVIPQLGNMAFSPSSLIVPNTSHAFRATFQPALSAQRLSWTWPQALPDWSRGDSMVAIRSDASGIYQLMHQSGGGAVTSPELNLPAPSIKALRIRAAFTGWPHYARLVAHGRSGPPAFLNFYVDSTGRMDDYVIPLGRSAGWSGWITSIVIQYAGDSLELQSASFEPYERS